MIGVYFIWVGEGWVYMYVFWGGFMSSCYYSMDRKWIQACSNRYLSEAATPHSSRIRLAKRQS
jgi:hypothetical protein